MRPPRAQPCQIHLTWQATSCCQSLACPDASRPWACPPAPSAESAPHPTAPLAAAATALASARAL
eukprot:3397173-Prymnesium_polylepis.1